jgi:hypothetical protein
VRNDPVTDTLNGGSPVTASIRRPRLSARRAAVPSLSKTAQFSENESPMKRSQGFSSQQVRMALLEERDGTWEFGGGSKVQGG